MPPMLPQNMFPQMRPFPPMYNMPMMRPQRMMPYNNNMIQPPMMNMRPQQQIDP